MSPLSINGLIMFVKSHVTDYWKTSPIFNISILQAITKMNLEYEEHKKEWQGKHDLTEYETLAVEYLPLDLSSFKSTQEFVETFKKSGRKVHILVCNAGIGMVPYGENYFKLLTLSMLGKNFRRRNFKIFPFIFQKIPDSV